MLQKLLVQPMNNFFAYRPLSVLLKAGFKVLLAAVLTAGFLLLAPAGRAQTNDYADTSYTTNSAVQDEPAISHEKTAVPQPFVYRQVPDSITRHLKKDKDFAYANDAAYWVKNPPPQQQKDFWDYFYNFFQGTTVRTIAYSLLIAFFLFVIYRIIVVNKLFLFYSSKKVKKEEGKDAVNLADDNLDEKIQKALDEKDNRMAVRYMYLKALKMLNDRQWIHFHAEATNYEYVNEMSKHKLANDFRFLTRVYDYMWYGEFALTNEQFEIVQNNFKHFYNAVNS
jgi:hypothetical protein